MNKTTFRKVQEAKGLQIADQAPLFEATDQTYLINPDRRIMWRHFDPDYKKRSKIKDILNALGGGSGGR